MHFVMIVSSRFHIIKAIQVCLSIYTYIDAELPKLLQRH